tara:strand:+ start:3151 stop:3981 length:831 start_codon:yes stop_codon:yes gene_type:complete
MRDPSIHIKESDLRKILEEGLEHKLFEVDVEYILRKAIKHSCNNRSVTITNDKLDKKVQKILKSSSTDANTFNNILFMVRKKNKHFGFKKLEENNSRDWGVIKDSASLALDFSNEFGLDRKKGFIKYCEIAISKMTKFSYPKLKSMYDSICQTYHFEKEISLDPTPDLTKVIHDYYNSIILRQVGTGIDHSKNPSNYYYFIEVKNICKEKKVKYQDYIKAQFHGMGFRNGIPHPAQLIGDKALERLTTYLFENDKRVNNVDKSKRKTGLAQIKNMK